MMGQHGAKGLVVSQPSVIPGAVCSTANRSASITAKMPLRWARKVPSKIKLRYGDKSLSNEGGCMAPGDVGPLLLGLGEISPKKAMALMLPQVVMELLRQRE